MFSKKAILILLILIMTSSSVFAIAINPLDRYISLQGASVSIQYDPYVGCTLLNIKSTNADKNIDFNYNVADPTIVVIKDGETRLVEINGHIIPYIKASTTDTLTLSSVSGCGDPATITVDSTAPVNNAALNITPLDSNYNSFYSGRINVSYTGSNITDSEAGSSGLSNNFIYVVPTSDLSNYSSKYEDKNINSGGSGTLSFIVDSLREVNDVRVIPDGNYYIVIDANDNSKNYCSSSAVLATKKNVYFDNTAPTLTSVTTTATGTITNKKLYIGETSFPLAVVLSDVSGISNTGAGLKVVAQAFNNHYIIDNTYSSGYSLTSTQIEQIVYGYEGGVPTLQPKTGDIFIVTINAIDNLGNTYDYDFNIILDLDVPSIPTTTVAIEDVDKNVTITRGNSTDTGNSGLMEYRVYKDDSSFTNSSGKELVCTMTTSQTSCVDSDDKSLDDDIYYGVVAVDNAGNISDTNSQKVWTGPAACTLSINNGETFTNTGDVNLKITYPSSGSDVNEVGFSCAATTAPTYVVYGSPKSFNITSGAGCNTTNGEKTIYARVKSKDYPTRFSICSDTISFDNTAPTTPTNLKSTAQSDGSAKLTWTASTESVDPDTVKYRVYYSTSSNLTNTADYKESTTNTYTFSSNQDINLYFKVSALDLRNNESELSSSVLANVKKIGPRFTFTIDPSNDVNGDIYVNSGTKTIEFLSDETLSENPQVTIKKANSSTYDTISSTYDSTTKKGSTTAAFIVAGTNIIRVTGTNTKNETAYSELEVIMDSTAPDFNFGHELADPVTYDMWVSNLSADVYKVEYLVDNNTVICSKQQVTDYNCNGYDLRETPDGNHTMYINVYDKALNKKTKTFTYNIDLVNEDKVACDSLRDEIATKLKQLEEDIDLFTAIGLINSTLNQTVNDKKTIVFTKRAEGNDKYSDENYLAAKADYQFSLNEIQAIDDLFPDIEITKSTTLPIIYDANVPLSLEEILDQNASLKTKQLYDSNVIRVDRNLEILKIGTQNFFSVKLIIKNTSSASKEITIVENIPKSFANNASKLVFNKEVEILVKDPVIKYTLSIPPNASEEIIYRSLTPVTAVDATTKYNLITEAFKTKLPLIIDGNVSTEKLDIKKPINMNIIIYFVVIILLLIIVVLIIGAINNYKNKQVEIKPDTKKIMNDYLGKTDKPQEQKTSEKSETKKPDTEEPKKKDSTADKFNEDYQYILSAIKRR